MVWFFWPTLVLAIAATLVANFLYYRFGALRAVQKAREESERILKEAQKDADNRRREAELEARDRLETIETSFEESTRNTRREMESKNRKLDEREKNLDRKASLLGQKLQDVENLKEEGIRNHAESEARKKDLEQQLHDGKARLEHNARLSSAEARQELLRMMETDARQEAVQSRKRILEEAREKADEEARRILATSMQRVPAHEISDNLTCVIPLPNEEMKGRIIGKEGRNIRSIEMNTGVDVIVDETPGAIVLSTFDPVRRELARISVEKLIEDGRIHPARIEEVTSKVRSEFEQNIQEDGEAAAFELALPHVHPKLIRLIGTLKYHGRVGQNLLDHSMEVAFLGQVLALELKADSEIVKRAALLHEIGHVAGPIGNSPPLLQSAEIAARYNEPEAVVHALRSLGGDVDPKNIEAVLLKVADDASLFRPGAQKGKVATQVTRLRRIEEIANSFNGVRAAYAVRAGNELRVIVESQSLSDADVSWLSKKIAARITSDQVYTGHVKISVIRETRAVDFAL